MMIAIRVDGLGEEVFLGVTATDLETGEVARRGPFTNPEFIPCHSNGRCDIVPFRMTVVGLKDPSILGGRTVRIDVVAENAQGQRVETSGVARLRRE